MVPRAQLLKKSASYFTLIGDKAPPHVIVVKLYAHKTDVIIIKSKMAGTNVA